MYHYPAFLEFKQEIFGSYAEEANDRFVVSYALPLILDQAVAVNTESNQMASVAYIPMLVQNVGKTEATIESVSFFMDDGEVKSACLPEERRMQTKDGMLVLSLSDVSVVPMEGKQIGPTLEIFSEVSLTLKNGETYPIPASATVEDSRIRDNYREEIESLVEFCLPDEMREFRENIPMGHTSESE